jgi:ribosome biogenesis GTPase / thiamine phosphate phosphatase
VHTENLGGLLELGWADDLATAFAALGDPGLAPARVTADFGTAFQIEAAWGSADARLGSGLQQAGRRVAVGDWVAILDHGEGVQIRELLPRRSAVRRKAPEPGGADQVLAANVDLVFIATAVGPDFNPRRIERLLTVAYQSGAAPVVVLTKADLEDATPYQTQVAEIAPGVPIVAVSGLNGEGIDEVRAQLAPGRTAVLVGSSGVGKSTLINRLLGLDLLRTNEVHRGGQGRHTTSHRQLIKLPGGGLIIDTPGLREVQLWAGDDALGQVFSDIEALASDCRFANCRHQEEPGCAVHAALTEGRLDPSRLKNYRKLQRELRAIAARADVRLRIEERRKWKVIQRTVKRKVNQKRGWE